MLITTIAIQFDATHLPCILAAIFAVVPMTTAVEVIEMNFDPRVFNSTPPAEEGRGFDVCTKHGDACDETCRKTGICIETNQSFVFQETRNCGQRFCDIKNSKATCETISLCVPNSQEIGCHTSGVFPDPYNCHNILTCKAGRVAKSLSICGKEKSFDSCTGMCHFIPPGHQCLPQAPLCNFWGDFGTWPYNDRIYYYCVKDEKGLLHPVLGRCDQGYLEFATFSCSATKTRNCVRNIMKY